VRSRRLTGTDADIFSKYAGHGAFRALQ
jgi:hypothetical protein